MQNIDIYYESLKQVYQQILNWPERKQPLNEKIADWFMAITAIVLALFVIPILPIGIVAIGSQVGSTIGPINLANATIGTFAQVWLTGFVIALCLFLISYWVNSRVDAHPKDSPKPLQSLSSDQLAFIGVYESYKELKIFFVSHIDQHVESSLKALRRSLKRTPFLRPEEYERYMMVREARLRTEVIEHEISDDEISQANVYGRSPDRLDSSLPRQISVARTFLQTFGNYKWFQIDSDTKSYFQAMISFSAKILPRLNDKVDLPAVLSVLENLSKFIYAYLPEHKTYMPTSELDVLQLEGLHCLKRFTQETNDLTPYSSPKKQKELKPTTPPAWREKIQHIFYANVLLRFTGWFVLIAVLTTAAVFFVSQRTSLSPDTMATLIIGSSVAGATALATFLPKTANRTDS